MRIALQGLFGLAIAAALLYWVLHDKDPKALRQALGSASWSMLAAAAVINLGHNVFRVWRWRWLLAPVRPGVPFRPMFVSVILGYMITFAGGRVGELVRPALLSAKEDLPIGPCVGSVAADRFLDGAAIVFLFAVGSLSAGFAPSAAGATAEIRAAAWIALVVIVVALAALILVSTFGSRVDSWLAARPGPIRWAGRAFVEVSRGVEALRSPRRLVPILILSIVAWLTVGLGTCLGIRAAGVPVGLADTLVLLPLLALGVAIPTPGAAGGYHAAMQFGLTTLFGVDATLAAGAGILMHLAVVLPIVALGAVMLFTEKISWSDLVAAVRQVKAMGAAPVPAGASR